MEGSIRFIWEKKISKSFFMPGRKSLTNRFINYKLITKRFIKYKPTIKNTESGKGGCLSMQKDKTMTEAEYRLAELIWENAPIGSGELVQLCTERLGWKKSTTYTMLRKL